MRISSSSGDFVELRLDGYQFEARPGRSAHDWDANWLCVIGHAQSQGEEWSFRDPCLTTWEARELLAWLKSFSANKPHSIQFTEPNLAFEMYFETRAEPTLVITLSGEAAPPSLSREARWDGGRPMRFHISSESLASVADDWERELAAYPAR